MPFPSFFKETSNTYLAVFSVSFLFLSLALWVGPGFTYDSHDYFLAGTNLKDFLQGRIINGKLIARPPLFPILVRIFSLPGKWGLSIMQLVIFSMNCMLFYRIIFRVEWLDTFRLVLFILFCFSISMHLSHSFLWTEGLVILLILIQVYFLIADIFFLKKLAGLLFFGAAMVLTKNGGMLLVPGFAAAMILLDKNWKMVVLSVLYLGINFSMYSLWNAHVSRPTVLETVARDRFFTAEYIHVISGWLFPLAIPEIFRVLLLGIFIGGLIISGSFRCLWKDRIWVSFFIIFLSYVLFRSYYSHVSYHEGERYLSLGFPFFLLWVTGLLAKSKTRPVLFFIFYWIIYSVIRVIKNDIIWFLERSQM